MDDNVLTDTEYKILLRLREKTFAGYISMETRARLEAAYKKATGQSPNVCWTCGGSTYNFARTLLNCI